MSSSSVVKCNTCNIVINEVLAFIQNQIDVMNEESIVRLCATAFTVEEVEFAKKLLFDSSQTSETFVKRKKGKTDGKTQRDLGDIISLLKTTSVELIPIFVAKDLRKLPPVTFDHVDVTRLLKDIIILKDELQVIKENYVTTDKLDQLKTEIINWKQASLVEYHDTNYVNIMKRGTRKLLNESYHLDSGPVGLMNLPAVTVSSPTQRVQMTASELEGDRAVETEALLSECRHVEATTVVSKRATASETDRSAQLPRASIAATRVAGSALGPPPVRVGDVSRCCSERVEPMIALSSKETTNSPIALAPTDRENKNEEKVLTFAEIAQKEGDFKYTENEEWKMVQRNRLKNKFIGKQGQSKEPTGRFKAADLKIPLFINNVDKESTAKDIADYIFVKTNTVVQLVEIKMKRQRDYKAFKVFIPKHRVSLFLDENLWPEGISFRKFINFRNVNALSTSSSEADNKP